MRLRGFHWGFLRALSNTVKSSAIFAQLYARKETVAKGRLITAGVILGTTFINAFSYVAQSVTRGSSRRGGNSRKTRGKSKNGGYFDQDGWGKGRRIERDLNDFEEQEPVKADKVKDKIIGGTQTGDKKPIHGRWKTWLGSGEEAVLEEDEFLKVQERVLGVCQKFNLRYEWVGEMKMMWVFVDGKAIKINQSGIYNMVDGVYYIPDNMSKSAGLTRFLVDFSHERTYVLMGLIMAFHKTIYPYREYNDPTYKVNDAV
ncbi:hypothetical protein [Bacillus subtilis]|uniref:hypothetical protein n=1 Tax=Bacillus subtilis TaxID=1423 RepID=UPI0020268194|nr:hypothetical protein [Bacillus subtilis]MCL9628465.1 hypothetical protein [Bacillus subtilis]